jgi:hypothetical protein
MPKYLPVVTDYKNFPDTSTPIDESALDAIVAALLQTNDMAVIARWDTATSTYLPAYVLADVGRPRLFIGPTDPQVVAGFVYDVNFEWHNTDPAPVSGGGSGGVITTPNGLRTGVPCASFAGTTADARLTAALSYASAETNAPPLQLEAGGSYALSRTMFNGLCVFGSMVPRAFNAEISGSRAEFDMNFTGSGVWWNQTTGTIYNVAIGGFSVSSTGGLGTFMNCSDMRESVFWDTQTINFKYTWGTPTSPAVMTDCKASGSFTVNAGSGTPVSLISSDSNFDWKINIGAGGTDGLGKPLMLLRCGKTTFGAMYFTARLGWYALNLQGDEISFVGNTFAPGGRFEGQNRTTPSDGALIICEGGGWNFSGQQNINYGMSNPSLANNTAGSRAVPSGSGMTTTRNDRGMVQVNGGNLSFDGITYDRTSTVAQTVPLACVAGGKLKLTNVRTGAKGGTTWSAVPVVNVPASGTGALLGPFSTAQLAAFTTAGVVTTGHVFDNDGTFLVTTTG